MTHCTWNVAGEASILAELWSCICPGGLNGRWLEIWSGQHPTGLQWIKKHAAVSLPWRSSILRVATSQSGFSPSRWQPRPGPSSFYLFGAEVALPKTGVGPLPVLASWLLVPGRTVVGIQVVLAGACTLEIALAGAQELELTSVSGLQLLQRCPIGCWLSQPPPQKAGPTDICQLSHWLWLDRSLLLLELPHRSRLLDAAVQWYDIEETTKLNIYIYPVIFFLKVFQYHMAILSSLDGSDLIVWPE